MYIKAALRTNDKLVSAYLLACEMGVVPEPVLRDPFEDLPLDILSEKHKASVLTVLGVTQDDVKRAVDEMQEAAGEVAVQGAVDAVMKVDTDAGDDDGNTTNSDDLEGESDGVKNLTDDDHPHSTRHRDYKSRGHGTQEGHEISHQAPIGHRSGLLVTPIASSTMGRGENKVMNGVTKCDEETEGRREGQAPPVKRARTAAPRMTATATPISMGQDSTGTQMTGGIGGSSNPRMRRSTRLNTGHHNGAGLPNAQSVSTPITANATPTNAASPAVTMSAPTSMQPRALPGAPLRAPKRRPVTVTSPVVFGSSVSTPSMPPLSTASVSTPTSIHEVSANGTVSARSRHSVVMQLPQAKRKQASPSPERDGAEGSNAWADHKTTPLPGSTTGGSEGEVYDARREQGQGGKKEESNARLDLSKRPGLSAAIRALMHRQMLERLVREELSGFIMSLRAILEAYRLSQLYQCKVQTLLYL